MAHPTPIPQLRRTTLGEDVYDTITTLIMDHTLAPGDRLNIPLNDSGGLIKGTRAELLEQSSTIANVAWHRFPDGTTETIPYAYFEFAFRHLRPETQRGAQEPPGPPAYGDYYHGFIAASADRIFESTDRSQVYRGRFGGLEAIPLQDPPALQKVPREGAGG